MDVVLHTIGGLTSAACRVAFLLVAGSLGLSLLVSWLRGLRDTQTQRRRERNHAQLTELLRRKRQEQAQEAQGRIEAAREEAAARAQAEAAARAQAAASAAASARALSESRQPGGGAVHASKEALQEARERLQEEVHPQDVAAGTPASAPGGGGLRQRGGGSGGTAASSSSVGPGRPRTFRGDPEPVFPGDELRGWRSPESLEAARIRQQQDVALAASLKRDREKEERELVAQRAREEARERKRQQQVAAEDRRGVLLSLLPEEPPPLSPECATLAVRLPDGSVAKRRWAASATTANVHNWVECMECATLRSFQLVKPFPRETVPISDGLTLVEASLCPQALLVLEFSD